MRKEKRRGGFFWRFGVRMNAEVLVFLSFKSEKPAGLIIANTSSPAFILTGDELRL